MAAVTDSYVNSESKCIITAICTNSAQHDGQTAQGRAGWRLRLMRGVTVTAGPAICGRRRGRTGWLPNPCVPALPARLVHRPAGSTGPQLLYQAIGAGNLRAWVQGQDDAGHVARSN